MKQLLTYILIFIATLLLFNCKKYEEDGKRSWHKPEKRIVGTWYLKEFEVNGADSSYTCYVYKSNDVTDTIRWQLINSKLTFKNDRSVEIYDTNVYVNNSLNWAYRYFSMKGQWSLQNKKQLLRFDSKYDYKKGNTLLFSFSVFGNVDDVWDIKKLTDKEMIVEAYSNTNKHLRLKFQK